MVHLWACLKSLHPLIPSRALRLKCVGENIHGVCFQILCPWETEPRNPELEYLILAPTCLTGTQQPLMSKVSSLWCLSLWSTSLLQSETPELKFSWNKWDCGFISPSVTMAKWRLDEGTLCHLSCGQNQKWQPRSQRDYGQRLWFKDDTQRERTQAVMS